MRTAKGFTYGYTEDVEAIDPRLKDYRDQEWEAEKRRAWVAFASGVQFKNWPDDTTDKDLMNLLARDKSILADAMLVEFEKRFKEEG